MLRFFLDPLDPMRVSINLTGLAPGSAALGHARPLRAAMILPAGRALAARFMQRIRQVIAAPHESSSEAQSERAKLAEAALIRRVDELEFRVAEEIAARLAAEARLNEAQRMQALGRLASGIAHDFNNVLQAIGGALYLIAKHPNDAAQVARFATLAEDAAFRGVAITGRLLSLSRRGEARTGPVEVAPLLSGMAELFCHTLDVNIAVAVDASPGLPPLVVDRRQLETVLINLAANARDAMPDGGMLALSATLDHNGDGYDDGGYIPGSVRGCLICITVADTGEGMDAATLARASEPFFTTKEPGCGTGLGLAMASSFAKQSGGAMRIESAPGKGTTVRLWLPCFVATEGSTAMGLLPPGSSCVQGRALVMDATLAG